MKISEELAAEVGKPQKISRNIKLNGLDILIRLQKPLEEPSENDPNNYIFTESGDSFVADIEHDYGTCIIIEAWSEATQTVMTQGIHREPEQANEDFEFAARYFLNKATDEEWLDTLNKKGVLKLLQATCVNGSTYEEPKYNPNDKKKKKKT